MEIPMQMKNFLINSDETGKFIVFSLKTGRKYYVEPILPNSKSPTWGDINPATNKIEGSYGKKYTGAVPESESVIKPENGFINIETCTGQSPFDIIRRMDCK